MKHEYQLVLKVKPALWDEALSVATQMGLQFSDRKLGKYSAVIFTNRKSGNHYLGWLTSKAIVVEGPIETE